MLEARREVLDLCLLELGLTAARVCDAQAHHKRLLAVHGVCHVQALRGCAAAIGAQGVPARRVQPQLHELGHGCLRTGDQESHDKTYPWLQQRSTLIYRLISNK